MIDPNVDQRNVIDLLKGLSEEDIEVFVRANTLPFAVAMVNWESDFNFSSLVRSANSFGARNIYYVSEKKRWDRRGAVGTYKYSCIQHFSTEQALLEELKKTGYTPVALEQTPKSTSLYNFEFPTMPCLILGSESMGLNEEMISNCEYHVVIPSYGSVRSINAACAASVAMSWVASQVS